MKLGKREALGFVSWVVLTVALYADTHHPMVVLVGVYGAIQSVVTDYAISACADWKRVT